MNRRLLILSGLAMLAVIINHGSSWGFIAMFWWTHRYRPVTVPNFDQMGGPEYYYLVIAKQLTAFAVPAFLFVTGFFIAYAARGGQATLNWKTVRVRLTNLLIPYLIWSFVFFVADFFQGLTYSPVEYARRLVLGDATGAYFFVPLLCQMYLLSPLVAPIAKTRWNVLFAVAIAVFLIAPSLAYLSIFGVIKINSPLPMLMVADWFFLKWFLYFALGLGFGLYLAQFRAWLARFKFVLGIALIIFGVLAFIEPEYIFQVTGQDWRGGASLLSTHLYALLLILWLVSLDNLHLPLENWVFKLGSKLYAVYLLHPIVLLVVAKFVYRFLPGLLGVQVLLQPLFIIAAIVVPLSMMELVARSPARKAYQYLFG